MNAQVWSKVSKLAPTRARPLLAATLILIDHSSGEPRVLMGRRNDAHSFMPGKFVFPGGRVDPEDRRMNVSGALAGPVEARLARVSPASPTLPRALALAAIRETYEETGLMIGTRDYGAPPSAPGGWADFATHGVYPDLEPLHFVARATTPPRLPKRYDTIFLAADASAICHRVDGAVGPEREFVETTWITLAQAQTLELPVITSVVLRELERRIDAGLTHFMPTPWYRVGRRGWVRDEM